MQTLRQTFEQTLQRTGGHPAPPTMLVGVDGGGTGTRVVMAHVDAPGHVIAEASGGPSALGLGVDKAWQAIEGAVTRAFHVMGETVDWQRCVIGCGLSGVHHGPWRDAFIAAAPPANALRLEGDAYTTVLGAHAGEPGVAIALGTGSIGIRLGRDGTLRVVGGFGFPSGDEASGAWLGMRIVAHAQKAVDGRLPMDELAEALLTAMGLADDTSSCGAHEAHWPDGRLGTRLLAWLIAANQTAYAALAPLIVEHADHPAAAALLARAGVEVMTMLNALDRDAELPLALCGSLAPVLRRYLPDAIDARVSPAKGDSARGALLLAHQTYRCLPA